MSARRHKYSGLGKYNRHLLPLVSSSIPPAIDTVKEASTFFRVRFPVIIVIHIASDGGGRNLRLPYMSTNSSIAGI